MAVYRITFTPSGPYFFGNEKSFKYPGNENNDFGTLYYIKGENMPSQSTILGALRYILLPIKGYENLKSKENIAAIGEKGFDFSNPSESYGLIKTVSPVFLSKGKELFIPTPFDHNTATPKKETTNGKEMVFYTPFTHYQDVDTSEGKKLFTAEYDSKEGIATYSFMSLSDSHIEKDLFGSDIRIGINRASNDLFKKEYKYISGTFSFSVFADIAGASLNGQIHTVMLGQGKVPFSVCFTECNENSIEDFYKKVRNVLYNEKIGRKRIYCLGNSFVNSTNLYKDMLFAVVQTQDYRNLSTNSNGKLSKSSILYHLVRAGSIFIPREDMDMDKLLLDGKNAKKIKKIGFNKFITI